MGSSSSVSAVLMSDWCLFSGAESNTSYFVFLWNRTYSRSLSSFFFWRCFFFLMVEMHLYQDLFLVQTQILPLDSCFFIGWIYYVYQDFVMTYIACHTLCKSKKNKTKQTKKKWHWVQIQNDFSWELWNLKIAFIGL